MGFFVDSTQTLMKKDLSERKILAALAKLEVWRDPQNGVPDWQAVGKALHLTHQAINTSPKYYKSWILLADIYFQLGKIYLAQKSLDKAYTLINFRPNFPGDYYERIEEKLMAVEKSGTENANELPIPDWFQKKYENYFYDNE